MLPNLEKFKVLAPQQMGIEDKNGLSQDNQKCLFNAIQMAQKFPPPFFLHTHTFFKNKRSFKNQNGHFVEMPGV